METTYFKVLIMLFFLVVSACEIYSNEFAPRKSESLIKSLESSTLNIDPPNKSSKRNGRQYFSSYPESRSAAYNTGYGSPTAHGSDGGNPYDIAFFM